jgi:hypothetical protein
MPPKVAALPSELIQHALQEAGLSAQEIHAIIHLKNFKITHITQITQK